jgi:hypothetical protein
VRDRSPEALQHRADGLTLVTAAIVLWNTVQIAKVLEEMRAEGEAIPKAMPPFLSPLGWQRINLTGDYIWSEGSTSSKGGTAASESEATPAAA